MSSGVKVADDVISTFQELKLGHKYKYIIMKISDDATQIVVDKTVGPDQKNWDTFTADLPQDDCRYVVYDFDFENTNKQVDQSKIVFILWAPDSCKIKQKMLYTSSKAELKNKLIGIGVEAQATDSSEIAREAILEKALRV